MLTFLLEFQILNSIYVFNTPFPQLLTLASSQLTLKPVPKPITFTNTSIIKTSPIGHLYSQLGNYWVKRTALASLNWCYLKFFKYM